MENLSHSVKRILEQIRCPWAEGTLWATGRVSPIFVHEGRVFFCISVSAEQANALEAWRAALEDKIRALTGVEKVRIVFTEEKQAQKTRLSPAAFGQALPQNLQNARIVAVASGKGGVGKSTTCVNLALALQAKGFRVGVLDADIYGPSLPRLLDLVNKRASVLERADCSLKEDKSAAPTTRKETVFIPIEKYGLFCMSMGFLVPEDQPIVWRSPMLLGALQKLLMETAWPQLDFLLIDFPPGTGDVPLTIAKKLPLCGVIVVSTPQDVALTDVIKSLRMFEKLDLPIIGLVENMSYFIAPDTGHRYDIFGAGKVERAAQENQVCFLGAIALAPAISQHADTGYPIVLEDSESHYARAYEKIAARVVEFAKKS